MVVDPEKLIDARYSGEYIQKTMHGPGGRTSTYSNEKERIRHFEEDLYRGHGVVQMPNKIDLKDTAPYNVRNRIHDAAKDLMRLVAETHPSVRCAPFGGTDPDTDDAQLRQSVVTGYWVADQTEWAIPEMVLHLLGGGGIYLLCTTSPHSAECDAEGYCVDPEVHSDYPVHELWHPRGAFPLWHGRKLVDFMYSARMTRADVEATWPELGIRADPKKEEWCEVVDLLTREEIYKCVWASQSKVGQPDGVPHIVDYRKNEIKRVPVAWVKEPSMDGDFEGMFDQAEGMQNWLNKAATISMMTSTRNAMQQIWKKGVLSEEKGPFGSYTLDPNPAVQSGVGLVGNREVPQSLYVQANFTREDLQGSVIQPAQRGGSNLPSIISGQGVQAVQGEQESVKWHVQRLIARVIQQALEIDTALDRKYLNYSKPVPIGSGTHRSYTPERVFPPGRRYSIEVIYAGAGASPAMQKVQMFQEKGLGLVDDVSYWEMDPNVADVQERQRRVLEQKQNDLLFQLIASQATLDSFIQFRELVGGGAKLLEAAKVLRRVEQEAAQAAQAAQAGNVIPFPGAPGQAAAQAQGLEKGAVPGGPAPSLSPEFPPQALPMIQYRGPSQ